MFVRLLTAACAVVLAVSSTAPRPAQADSNWTMQLELRGHRIEGTVVHLSEKQVTLLGRDGRLWDFAPGEAKDFHKVSSTFRGYSHGEMRAQLVREFGRKYEVSGTGHYLVVHPAGRRDQWANRFELLYRSFVHYFTAHGIRPKTPDFPLVAVVFPSQREYMEYVASKGHRPSSTTLGHYSPTTNRIVLYDVTRGQAESEHWHVNAETIVHEATHQMAFNTGIHNRLSTTPLWVAEGLATMFEAPGVWDRSRNPKAAQRVNRYMLDRFQASTARNSKGWLQPLIVSEKPFATNPDAAYALAWATTFYLMEKQPAAYGRYLRKTVAWPADRKYGAKSRWADFTSVFGADLKMLETRIVRYAKDLSD